MSVRIAAVIRSPLMQTALDALSRQLNGVDLAIHAAPLADARRKLGNGNAPDVLIVEPDADDESELGVLQDMVRTLGSTTAFLATSSDASVTAIRRLMRMGVTDFLPQPFSAEELASSVAIAIDRIAPSRARSGGRVISVVNMVGGAGATTLAIQIARSAVRGASKTRTRSTANGRRTCLLDLDIQGGSAAHYLDLKPKYSILDVAGGAERLDATLLESSLLSHASGLRLLAAPTELAPFDSVEPEVVRGLVDVARGAFDLVVVDLPHTWSQWTTTVLSATDLIVFVMQLSVASIEHTRRRLAALGELGIEHRPVCLLVNRHEKGRLLGGRHAIREAEKILGRKIDYFIGNDSKTVSESLDLGRPLADLFEGKRIEREFRRFTDYALDRIAASVELHPQTAHERAPVATGWT